MQIHTHTQQRTNSMAQTNARFLYSNLIVLLASVG
jgi:hypothetical protein